MKRASLHLLVILLALCHVVVSSNAAPSSRVRTFQQETSVPPVLGDVQIVTEEGMMEEVLNGRMDLESNDYPGSGANNRHTPNPPARS